MQRPPINDSDPTPGEPSGYRFTSTAVAGIRDEIQAAGGREVFFVGRIADGDLVDDVEVAARGTEGAVPAVALGARPGDMVVHNHPSGTLHPSDADLDVAARLGTEGIGFAIVDNECTRVYVVVEPHRPEAAIPLDLKEIETFFAPEGALARVLKGYEPRPAQVEMALASAGAFDDGRVVVLEAGTGVGKSLAYLVPAVMWARRNRRRVVISTNTINLQEQLVSSDLPLLRAAGLEFEAVLVKGRRNYACLRKAEEIRAEPDLFAESEQETDTLRGLATWAFASPDGSLADLAPVPPDDLWEEISTQSDDCTRTRCHLYNECHFYRARRRAASADLLIVNHHLLFADLALRRVLGSDGGTAVLPSYSNLVLDEAHHIEEVATSHFGSQVSSAGLQRHLGRLQSRRRSSRGLLPLLLRHLSPLADGDPQAARALDRLESEVRPALAAAHERVPALFGDLARSVNSLLPRGSRENRLRLTEDVESDPGWAEVGREHARALQQAVSGISASVDRLLRDLEPIRETYRDDLDSPFIDIAAAGGRLAAASAALGRFIEPEDDSSEATVRWLEAVPGRGDVPRLTLSTAPIEVGPHLERALFEVVDGAVLSSATLAVDGGFDFIRERLGLDLLEPGRLVAEVLPSPFVHAKQVLFLVPDDLPEPTEGEHPSSVAGLLAPAIVAAGGRTLVLLTSYGSMQQMHELLQGPLAEEGIRLRRQGEAPRTHLLENLRGGEGEALMATDSFWEGIDVRGEALSLLALTRLPFRVPTDPVLVARAERLEREGGNAFAELLVPMAVLKFKQGMGRLIRHRGDRGVALVLDPRILHRSYGRTFLDSLGWGEPMITSTAGAVEQVRAWFVERRNRDHPDS